MNYNEVLDRIHSLNKFGSRPGLERICMLLESLGNPQDSLSFVHVAGTNGKGSVCQMVSSVLRASHYKTGLFISPYITDFRERIQINNELIEKEKLVETAEYVFSHLDKLNAEGIIITEFEFVMAVALEFFKREKVEVVVFETGLGGRLDCTNVIKPPLCAVITRIGLDHTDILGDTIELIAKEKSGIIKEGSAVVSSEQLSEALSVIENTCRELDVPFTLASTEMLTDRDLTLTHTAFTYKGERIKLYLTGEHQVQNAASALMCLETLKAKGFENISSDTIKEGFLQVRNPARLEVLSENPLVILDGAHNKDGMETFANSVKTLSDGKGVLIIGMLKDKDSRGSLELIDGMFTSVYTVPIDNPRALTSEEMGEIAREHFESVTVTNSVQEALSKALSEAQEKNIPLFVCGSLYLAGEIRPLILEKLKK